jgi:hypothetical protein
MGCLEDDWLVSFATVDRSLGVVDLRRNRKIVISELEELEMVVRPCKVGECRAALSANLRYIAELSADSSTERGHCFGSALEAAGKILAEVGGIVLGFIFGGPTVGPWAMGPRSREEMSHELSLFKMPDTEWAKFYRGIALKFSELSISLSVFVASKEFVDLGVLAVPCCTTGGRCYHYTDFRGRLHADIVRVLSAKYFWNASLRLHVSSGFVVQRMQGNGLVRARDCVVVPVMSQTDSFTFDLLPELHVTKPSVTFQLVLSWTPGGGVAMLRIFTFSLAVREDLASVVNHADEATLLTLLVKRSLTDVLLEGPGIAVNKFVTAIKKMSPHQFKSLPRLGFGMLQSALFRESCAARVSDRISEVVTWRSYGIVDALLYCYPRLTDVREQQLLPLVKESFVDRLLVLHTVGFVAIWGQSETVLCEQAGKDCRHQSFVSVDTLDGTLAEQIRALVRSAWELSWTVLPVTAIVGLDSVTPFITEGTIGPGFSLANWTRHGFWE